MVGALIVSRQPRNAPGWLFCLIGLSSGASGVALEYATYGLVARPDTLPGAVTAAWLDTWISMPGFTALVLVPLLFPDGRPATRRWRPVVWLAMACIVTSALALAVRPGPLDRFAAIDNPYGLERARSGITFVNAMGGALLNGLLVAGVVSLVLRYRRSRALSASKSNGWCSRPR